MACVVVCLLPGEPNDIVRRVPPREENAGVKSGGWHFCVVRPTAFASFFPRQTVYSFPDVQYVVYLSSPVIRIFAHLCVAAVTFDPAMFALSSVSGICKAFELLTVSVVWYPAPADELVGHENNLRSQI